MSAPPPSLNQAQIDRPGGGSQRVGTPTALRIGAILCVIAVLLAAIVSWVLTDRLVDATKTIDTSTGPVLIDNQGILASLAEANAAGAAVHLAGGCLLYTSDAADE